MGMSTIPEEPENVVGQGDQGQRPGGGAIQAGL